MDGLSVILKEVAKEATSKNNDIIPKFAKGLEAQQVNSFEKADRSLVREFKGIPLDGHGGNYLGEKGNSFFKLDKEFIPTNPLTNPNNLSLGQICSKYNIEGINFKNGQPDFSPISKWEVKIENFSENRYGKGGNFDQALDKLVEITGMNKKSIKKWMIDNKYTFHECTDCRTMQCVPTEVHGNIRHSGGVSAFKSQS